MEEEFIHIIQEHCRIIHKVCSLYCKHAEERKDLFQEIVLQVWKSFPRFRKESSITTWMYSISLNTAISTFRKDARNPEKVAITDLSLQFPDSTAFPDREQVQILYKAIEHLTDVEKAIILLHLEEKTYEEIAFVIGITKTNVGVRLTRIKTKLEKILNALDYEHR